MRSALAAGLLAAWTLAGALDGLLFGVAPTDAAHRRRRGRVRSLASGCVATLDPVLASDADRSGRDPAARVKMRCTSMPALFLLLMTAAIATACGNPASSTPTTGLTGVVVRGPITPVCRIDIPCDAPFSAGFSVQQSGRQVGEFRSDSEGRFTVWLFRLTLIESSRMRTRR